MKSFRSRLSVLSTTCVQLIRAQSQCGDCQSFGVDFVNGGSYFQNSLSLLPFTAIQEFEGCTNDTAYNVLVAPNGTQFECSMTPMQPDDTPEVVTCPVDQDELSTGEWSILVLSNNGNCAPIDYQRDFFLSVGPQSTEYVSPTISITTTITPILNRTVTATETITFTGAPITITVPAVIFDPTITVYPTPVIVRVVSAIFTITAASQVPRVVATSTVDATAQCENIPGRRRFPDSSASIVAIVLNYQELSQHRPAASPIPATDRTAGAEYRRALLERRPVDETLQARYLAERHERLALQKRGPDQPTITVTNTLGQTSTITVVSTLPTMTITGTTTVLGTLVVTPTITEKRGIQATIVVVTAPARTNVLTERLPVTTVQRTTTIPVTLTVTSTITPSAAAESCSRRGGQMQ